jgi:hypothetical protein
MYTGAQNDDLLPRAAMPLTATTSQPVLIEECEAVGIWMSAGEQGFIRVFISCRALEELEPTRFPDATSALDIFASNRQKIEEVASAKFDLEGADEDDRFEDRPTLMLRSTDFD